MEEVKRIKVTRTSQLEAVPELIQHIQSLLPVKEAARTCVLSRSWLHAWSTNPTLRFGQSVDLQNLQRQISYINLIDRTILRYFQDNIPITSFQLKMVVDNEQSYSFVNKWIRQLVSQSCIKLYIYMYGFHMSDEMFTSENLKKATSNQCSVTCIRWSPCGSFIALGFSKNLVELYSFEDCADLRSLVEIEAHSGSVNDISILAERSIIITCGQDCLIKTWNLDDGENREILRGHINSVAYLSVSLEGPKLLIYSVDDRGKVRAWELMSEGKGFEVTSINYDGCVIHDIVSNLDDSM